MRIEAKTFETKDGDELVLLFDFDGQVAAEQVADAKFAKVVEQGLMGRKGYLRALLFGGLQAHQPRTTLARCSELIETEGDTLGIALLEAIAAAMPKRIEGEAENPPTARGADGTGTRSSPRGSKKVSTKPASGNKRRAATR